jgi:hypothetical protein
MDENKTLSLSSCFILENDYIMINYSVLVGKKCPITF